MASEALDDLVGLLAAVPVDADAEVGALRSGYELLAGLAVPAAVETEVVDLDGVRAERHVPPSGDEDRVVVHLHGGGYVIGSPATHRPLATHLAAATGCVVVVPDYRLAPEHPLPAALDDARRAWRALEDVAAIALTGDSAGGGLSVALACALRDDGGRAPAAIAVQSPWTDLSCTLPAHAARGETDVLLSSALLERWSAQARGALDPTDPVASPLHGDLAGLPPLLVHVSDAEVLHDDGTALVEAVRAVGGSATLVEEAGLPHVWPFFAGALPEADATIRDIAAFLLERLR